MPKDLKLSVREDGEINTFTTEELFGGTYEHHRRLLLML